jgi:flagellar hook-associated protein 1 FlgK
VADILDIGISGLKAQQTALAVTGHNITNAGTEGYSRQRVEFNENTPQFQGGVWTGNGVNVDSIERVYDEFLTEQLRRDTSIYNEFDALALNASQIDSLLADPGTGIQPGLERMFGALQSVVDDPSSLPARQVLISEANGLVDRFSSINDRLEEQTDIINGQMEVIAAEITTLGKSIAELNEQITFALAASNGSPPNDMLDQRDKLLKDLAQYVAVESVEQDGSAVNVFIGNGQALVIGNESNELFAQAGNSDPSRIGIFFRKGDVVQEITAEIDGGELGGILDFRDQVLEPTINGLGRVALSIADTFNAQHKLGIDFEGNKGGDFFEDINTPRLTYARVQGDARNADPDDRLVSAHIVDTSQLSTSNYVMEFPGPDDFIFKVYNQQTGAEVLTTALTGELPQTIEFDGIELRLEGGTFQEGDRFFITPTRSGANDIEMKLTRPEEIAMATAISTDSAIGNRGSGAISQGSVYDADTPYLDQEGELDPPLLIRFTSPTTYDVLDNSDPGNPIPLFPPLMNQVYVPGISNDILPGDEGKTAFTSFGGNLVTAPTYQAPAPAPTVTATNGFFPERIVISREDPRTGLMTEQPLLQTPANASAKEIARLMSERDGVEASARTTVQLTNFNADGNPLLNMGVEINGIEITDTLGPNQTKYAAGYPETVPDPVDADFIAGRINANFDFQDMGIIAKSDGTTVTIIALNGEDISFDVTGDLGDSFDISNGQDIKLQQTGEAPFVNLTEFDGYDFSVGGPYTYDFEMPGQGTFSIELTGTHATGADVLNEIQSKIDSSGLVYSGNLDVSIDEIGNISFQPRLTVNGTGPNGSNKIAMGGEVKVVLDENYSMEIAPPGNNLFPQNPVGEAVHFGFEVAIDGLVQEGDEFTVNFNQDGTSDSRNGVQLGLLQTADSINGNASYSEAYATLVEEVGSITSRAQINKESSEVLLRNSQDAVDSTSGVNLDEEAAALIQYELAYNASAQIIQVARDIFDTLISTFR